MHPLILSKLSSQLQVMSSDALGSEALRQRLSEEGAAAQLRMPAGRGASLEDGSSSFAALFGGPAPPPQSAFASAMVRRDSGSSLVSSRLDDLGALNLDLPGLQASFRCILDMKWLPGTAACSACPDNPWQESTLLRLAERQAGREEELVAARAKVAELEAELGDLQREVELRQEQETALKEVCAPVLPLSYTAAMSCSEY
jgi:hypothetical protein